MRYLLVFVLVFSANLFAQEPPAPVCQNPAGGANDCGFAGGWPERVTQGINICVNNNPPGIIVSGGQCHPDSPNPNGQVFTCYATCSCASGFKLNTIIDSLGRKITSCVSDDPTPNGPDDPVCVSPQVSYEGFCRDGVGSPGDCGSTYTTAVKVGDLYACSNNGCSAGQNQSVFTNPSGSWNVCGDGDGDGEGSASSGSNTSTGGDSSGGNTSSPSSNGSGGDSSSGSGPGTGGGSGNGSGTGTGNGSGASSSSPTNPGSGSASSGIGLGGEADASNCENGEPHCDGDPIQCAILVQLWINACAGYDQEQTNNPDDDNDAIEASFVALISSAEPSVNAEGVLTAMTPGGGNGNGTGSGSGPGTGSGNGGGGSGIDLAGLDGAANSGAGGTCPPDRSISLGTGNFNVSYQFFCDFASQVSGLVILIFSYVGVMIVYRSLNW